MNLDLAKSRKEIYLPKLSTKSRSKTYLVYDVESDLKKISKTEEVHIPKLICARIITLYSSGEHTLERECFFFKIRDFHFWVYEQINKYHTLYFVAHNTSYDITTSRLFDLIHHIKGKCVAFNPNHGNYYVQFSNKAYNLIIIDSLNWFLDSLENVGKSINFKKTRMPKTKGISMLWVAYCMNDVNVVCQAMIHLSQYLAKFDLGDLRITRASISFTIFRKHFHATNLLHTTNLKVLDLEYQSYFGGRTEMFRHGKLKGDQFYYYDFNSLYPSVMINNKFSTKLRRHFTNSSLEQLQRMIKNYGCIARVKVKVDRPYFPCSIEGFTAFPIGTFITTLSTPELKFALERNCILEVYELSVYQQKEIFTEFVRFFHAEKQKHKRENNTVSTRFDKLILNTLYGKFGQKIDSLTKIKDAKKEKYYAYDLVALNTRKITKMKIINHVLYSQKKTLVSTYSIPSIATEVTSYARVKLLESIIKIGWNNVFYCDTDSVITNKKGHEIIKKNYEGHELGEYELEDQSDYVEIFALKDYNFNKSKKRKSIPSKSKKIAKNTYEYTHFSTTREGMVLNQTNSMRTKKQKKTLSRKYTKGIVNKDGTISPIILDCENS